MPQTIHLTILWAALLAVAAGTQEQSQKRELIRQLILDNSFELKMGDQLTGRGADFLKRELENSQFLMLGEPHNVAEIPLLAVKLLELARPFGFKHLALEQGPVITPKLAEAGRVKGFDGVIEIAERYPDALHFYTDQELKMIADAAGTLDGPGLPVWGLDRVLSSLPILDDLLAADLESELRVRIGSLRDRVARFNQEHLLERERLSGRDSAPFLELTALLQASPDSEVRFRMNRLRRSVENIKFFKTAARDNPNGYLSNLTREVLLKDNFLHYYRKAETGENHPRVIFKFGQWHAAKGLNPGNVYTLGNFLFEFARSHDLDSLFLNLQPVNKPGQHWSITDYPAYRPLHEVADVESWVVVDLRPLRPYVHNKAITVDSDFREWIFGFDAVVLMGNTSAGSVNWARDLIEAASGKRAR